MIRRLPLLRTGLILITAIYLLRALALPAMLYASPDHVGALLVWSSLVVFIYAVVQAVGVGRARRSLR